MKIRKLTNAAISTIVGGGAGAVTYSIIGGVGVTALGTGVGITAGPFIAIGAGVALIGHGIFKLGKRAGRKNYK